MQIEDGTRLYIQYEINIRGAKFASWKPSFNPYTVQCPYSHVWIKTPKIVVIEPKHPRMEASLQLRSRITLCEQKKLSLLAAALCVDSDEAPLFCFKFKKQKDVLIFKMLMV